MKMHNPPHPGEVLRALCLEPLGLTVTAAATSAPGQPEDAVGHSQRPRRYQSRDGCASVAGLRNHRGKLDESAGAVRPVARRTELEKAARDQAVGRLIIRLRSYSG